MLLSQRTTSLQSSGRVLQKSRACPWSQCSSERGVMAATLSEWRNAFLASAEAGLKSREPSAADEENLRLREVSVFVLPLSHWW